MNAALIKKYNVPGPRYTSYPTVPFWKNQPLDNVAWLKSLDTSTLHEKRALGLYIHLPFCEALCTFCGCHKRITKNHGVEQPYIDTVLAEWALYQAHLGTDIQIKELHLGGGTPTFFAPNELIRLTKGLFAQQLIDPDNCDLSFEAHPGSTTTEHLKELYQIGYRRVSFGIQDYDPVVQKAIHRVQSIELVQKVHKDAKALGYSINHDLVYGLPFQHLQGFSHTIDQTIALMPERIALYGYAHVPWVKGTGQRGYDEENLPKDAQKRALYEMAYDKLLAAGYIAIGMDHFALPNDALSVAYKHKNLHRNFMGYTHRQTDIMLGLGMSAISDSWLAFAQNDKTVEGYQAQIQKGELAVFRGHFLNEEELIIRRHILDLMCHFETSWDRSLLQNGFYQVIMEKLQDIKKDQLLQIDHNKLVILPEGRPFVRNICMAFDLDLQRTQPDKPLFSATI
ncbi:MAG: oxygen-independent coproporphyrinogen III oxidase [Flavobacteriales bacterium]